MLRVGQNRMVDENQDHRQDTESKHDSIQLTVGDHAAGAIGRCQSPSVDT